MIGMFGIKTLKWPRMENGEKRKQWEKQTREFSRRGGWVALCRVNFESSEELKYWEIPSEERLSTETINWTEGVCNQSQSVRHSRTRLRHSCKALVINVINAWMSTIRRLDGLKCSTIQRIAPDFPVVDAIGQSGRRFGSKLGIELLDLVPPSNIVRPRQTSCVLLEFKIHFSFPQ